MLYAAKKNAHDVAAAVATGAASVGATAAGYLLGYIQTYINNMTYCVVTRKCWFSAIRCV